jgi:hypothetical protein
MNELSQSLEQKRQRPFCMLTAGRAQFGPPGYEVDLLYLACLAALVLGGSGPMAIDPYLRKKSERFSYAALAIASESVSTRSLESHRREDLRRSATRCPGSF